MSLMSGNGPEGGDQVSHLVQLDFPLLNLKLNPETLIQRLPLQPDISLLS